MEKTLYLQSEFTQLELKHYDDTDTFSLNLLAIDGSGYLSSNCNYSREEFEQLEKTIRFLLS
jgi:hypothetical protein